MQKGDWKFRERGCDLKLDGEEMPHREDDTVGAVWKELASEH